MNFLLTCQSGLESLVKSESEKLGLQNISGNTRFIEGVGDLSILYSLSIGSRFANRVYMKLAEGKATDFDMVYSLVAGVHWHEYLPRSARIVIEASSTRSALTNTPSIQSIAEKALRDTYSLSFMRKESEIHILILIIDDIARILLDVTGEALHKRGYRKEQGEAPIKETLAAALVSFAHWKYSTPFLDSCTGSGTIAIEAAMIARNIPPGLHRRFRFEELPFHQKEGFEEIKENFRKKIFDKKYTIIASDIDEHMIEIARANAERAGVADTIEFRIGKAQDILKSLQGGTLVANPPYGNRLDTEDMDELYNALIAGIEQTGSGGFITTREQELHGYWKNKKLLNGNEECRFWYIKKGII